jgi:hypothetical protein
MKHLVPLIALITLAFFPGMIYAQAPYLGTAANFVLFSRNGAVSNTGISQLTGNVGTNIGSSTGFGNVNGQMHDQDGASGAASADVLLAYQFLNNMTATKFPAPNLGGGDTLTAAVYAIAGAATLNNNLYLDAKGDGNALFVFKINGAFSSGTLAKVNLIHGAQACNVFWVTEDMVGLAGGTVMRGTIIANNAAITLNTGDTLEGRALSTTGAITVHGTMAYTPIGCGSPTLTGPAAAILGTSGCYALFSGNGGVTNAGTSFISGDVGTNVGLTTGFNALDVNGTIHPVPDLSTAAAAADLLNVYTYLNTLPYDIELLYPAQFGNNLVLTPHTYLMNAATALTDTVFLDAQGNTDAVFVIKINGALSTSTYAVVQLVNGTQAKNIFWKVDGAVNLNNFAQIAGTIVCNSGANSLTTGVRLNGRMLTTTGALSTQDITTTLSIGTCAALPVNWLSFQGKATEKGNLLQWSTTKEVDNGFFTIERSKDGRSFQPIANIKSGGSPVNGALSYTFTDQQPYALTYYRISQTDINGTKSYYRIIQVNSNHTEKVYQYIYGNNIRIETTGLAAGNGSITLYSIDGRKVSSLAVKTTDASNSYQIAKPQQKGLYFLQMESNGLKVYGCKIIIE